MDVADLVVTSGLIAHKGSTSVPQLIQVTARTANIETGVLDLTWQNVEPDNSVSAPFATAKIVFSDSMQWISSWSPMAHLVQHRIEMLETLAAQGQANRLSRNMAYTLFANNLVDYADKYRGMQSVVMDGLEAFAEVQLSTNEDGAKFTVPPYFIDSVAHLAGFIMNCSDSMDTQKNYCVTSGWKSMRFAEPLVAGARYRSYVKMILTKEDLSVFLGDVYILNAEHNTIVGMVGGIHFRCFPRILLSRFFTAPEVFKPVENQAMAPAPRKKPTTLQAPTDVDRRPVSWSTGSDSTGARLEESKTGIVALKPVAYDIVEMTKVGEAQPSVSLSSTVTTSEGIITPRSGGDTIADKALIMIAQETALDISDLEDAADFASLGIDSLMSLVLAEKLGAELNVKVNGSLFLDYPTIGDLREWLVEYYN